MNGGIACAAMRSVNTPTKRYGVGAGRAAHLAAWEMAGRDIARFANRSKIIVEKSTVPVFEGRRQIAGGNSPVSDHAEFL